MHQSAQSPELSPVCSSPQLDPELLQKSTALPDLTGQAGSALQLQEDEKMWLMGAGVLHWGEFWLLGEELDKEHMQLSYLLRSLCYGVPWGLICRLGGSHCESPESLATLRKEGTVVMCPGWGLFFGRLKV